MPHPMGISSCIVILTEKISIAQRKTIFILIGHESGNLINLPRAIRFERQADVPAVRIVHSYAALRQGICIRLAIASYDRRNVRPHRKACRRSQAVVVRGRYAPRPAVIRIEHDEETVAVAKGRLCGCARYQGSYVISSGSPYTLRTYSSEASVSIPPIAISRIGIVGRPTEHTAKDAAIMNTARSKIRLTMTPPPLPAFAKSPHQTNCESSPTLSS